MKIAIVRNNLLPDEGLHQTGYGTYLHNLQLGFEQLGHNVDQISAWNIMQCLDDSASIRDLSRAVNNQALYEQVVPNLVVGPTMIDFVTGYDIVVFNLPLELPHALLSHHEVVRRAVYVVHDLSWIDPWQGRLDDGSTRQLEDWTYGQIFSSDRSRQMLDYYAPYLGDPDWLRQADDSEAECFKKFYSSLHYSMCDALVLCPTKSVATVLQNMSGTERVDRYNRLMVTPHFAPSQLPRWVRKAFGYRILSMFSWPKYDFLLYLQTVREMPDIEFVAYCNTECEQHLRQMLTWFPHRSLPNLELRPITNRQHYLEQLSTERFSASFHPVNITETFGFHLYEMAHAGIPTVLLEGDGGLQENADRWGHLQALRTVESCIETLRLAIRREFKPITARSELPTANDYAELILWGMNRA